MNQEKFSTDPIEEGSNLRHEIRKRIAKKDYLVTIYETGDSMMGLDDVKRLAAPRRYFRVCSLVELPNVIKSVGRSIWYHADLKDGMSKEEVAQIPFEEKKWAMIYDIDISPLSEEKVEQFQHLMETGSLDAWRTLSRKEDEHTQTSA